MDDDEVSDDNNELSLNSSIMGIPACPFIFVIFGCVDDELEVVFVEVKADAAAFLRIREANSEVPLCFLFFGEVPNTYYSFIYYYYI